ncbi:hypothetical protein C4K40_3548 [Pseudomonas sp. CMR5c]|nr:hypothetical protein C4K40_3548 [Pseudomonas sp. CMR5c]
MGSPHSGRLPLARSASEYPTDRTPSKQRGARLSGIPRALHRLSGGMAPALQQ